MSVEAKVYSAKPLLTTSELAAHLAKWGLELRFLDGEGRIPTSPFTGPLDEDYVILGWDAKEKDVTAIVDGAIAAHDKKPIDELGEKGKLAWCELYGRQFDYKTYWSEFPDEIDEYEESIEPETLKRIKSAKTRYCLRSGVRPELCAKMVDGLARVLVKATNGIMSD